MAQDFEVNCIVKRGSHYDPHERIEKLGYNGKWMMSEDLMIRKIEAKEESFYTLVNGKRADIIVAVHNNRKYLKTTADGYAPNNLLNLPECRNCNLVG
jgi:uncharacterized protein YlzI (FlbEa/FlbD family)